MKLTKKRQAWIKQRDPEVMRGSRLNYNASLQAKYHDGLSKLVSDMTQQTMREVARLFKSETAGDFYDEDMQLAQDADLASQARILTNALTSKFSLLFASKAKTLTERMISGAAHASKSTLHMSLKKLSGGLAIKTDLMTPELKTVIKASTTENVALIKSIAKDYLSKVQKTVMRSIINGNGLQTLIPQLQKYEGITKRHAKNMALDQTRKVYNSINAARMEKAGIKKFEWVHSGGGQKPREDHIRMDGKIFSFDDLPIIDKKTGERGIPGQAINCGCTMVPVIEFNEDN